MGSILDPALLDRGGRPAPTPSCTWRPARRSPLAGGPHGQPRGQRHRDHAGSGGCPAPRPSPGGGGLLLLGLRGQSGPAQAGGHGGHAGQPLRGQQAGHRVLRPGLRAARSASRSWPSGSSTCSARCRPPTTPTPPWSPPSSPPPCGASRCPSTATGGQTRDFTFVGTVAGVLADAVRPDGHRPDRPVNLAFGTRVSLLELIDVWSSCRARPCSGPTSTPGPATSGTPRPTRPSCAGSSPMSQPVTLDDGLRATLEWFGAVR